MALATGTAIRTLASSPTLADRRLTSRQPVTAANPHSISLPRLSPPLQDCSPVCHPQDRESLKSIFYSCKSTRNIVAKATGETPAEVAIELPEIVTTIQEAAIDRLPLLPGLFELIGIGYSGWFAYRYLVFKPDREALIAKVKNIYSDVIGSS